jgi:hypothetical protein
VLDIEHGSVVRLLVNGGTVFAALSQNQAARRGLITSADQTFATTAMNNNAIAATFKLFPPFLDQTKATMTRLKAFALDADPLTRSLQPVATDRGPTLHSVRVLSPDLRRLFVNLGPLITVSETGLPAIRDVLRGPAAARLSRAVPGAAQSHPRLAVEAPAADLRLHLQRCRRACGEDDLARWRRSRSLPAPVLADRAPDTLAGADPRSEQPRQHVPAAAVARRPDGAEAVEPAGVGLQQHRDRRARAGERHRADRDRGVRVAPPLPRAQPGRIPHITSAQYSSK